MSDPNADFKTLLDLTGGVQVRNAEHPDDRRQRHRLEGPAVQASRRRASSLPRPAAPRSLACLGATIRVCCRFSSAGALLFMIRTVLRTCVFVLHFNACRVKGAPWPEVQSPHVARLRRGAWGRPPGAFSAAGLLAPPRQPPPRQPRRPQLVACPRQPRRPHLAACPGHATARSGFA